VYKVGQRLQFLQDIAAAVKTDALPGVKPFFISFRICGERWYIDCVWYYPTEFKPNQMVHVELSQGDWSAYPERFISAIRIVHQISIEYMTEQLQDAMTHLRGLARADPARNTNLLISTALPSGLLQEQKYGGPAKALSRLVSFQFDR
jgi:hypothetical protein